MKTSSIFAKRPGMTGLAGAACAAFFAAANPAAAQILPGDPVSARNMILIDFPNIHCVAPLAGFTPDRFGALPANRMQVVAMYDGDDVASLGIHLWNPATDECCVETIDYLNNSQIVTQEFNLNGYVPTGAFDINGVVANGAIDGVAFGIYYRDAAGDRHVLRSAGAGLGAGIPNFAGGWPVAWSQTDWDNKLTRITGTNYDAFVARRQAQITLSGAQFLPNGRHHVPTDKLLSDLDGSGCVDDLDYGHVLANLTPICDPLNCAGIAAVSGFTSDRFGGLPADRMQVVAAYDGDPGNVTLTIHLWNRVRKERCELMVSGLTNSAIRTEEYIMSGFEPTGRVDVAGVVPNGGIDGVAFALYFRNAAGDRRVLRGTGAGWAAGTPNFVGGWPVAWSQTDWDNRLTGLPGSTYDAFVLRRQAQITLSGAQFLPNGVHSNFNNWPRPLMGDIDGDGCVDGSEVEQVLFDQEKGCCP